MPLYEAMQTPRDMRHLSTWELRKYFADDDAWQPNDGARLPIEVETLDHLTGDAGWFVSPEQKITEKDLRHVVRAIERDGLYAGKRFVVRKIEGARLGA